MVIDPGSEAERIIECIDNKRLNVLAILNTHSHYDHIGAVTALKTNFSVPFYLHSKDVRLLKYANLFCNLFDADESIPLPGVDYYFDQVEIPICLADFSIQVLYTPGHTPGSVCFLIKDNLFTGDTLFKGKIGRVDLPGGEKTTLRDSLRSLSLFSPQTKIYPGHGKTSTILEEIHNNHEWSENIHES